MRTVHRLSSYSLYGKDRECCFSRFSATLQTLVTSLRFRSPPVNYRISKALQIPFEGPKYGVAAGSEEWLQVDGLIKQITHN